MKAIKSLFTVASVIAVIALHGAANAQAFPTKPVTLVVPYPAGGLIDAVAHAEFLVANRKHQAERVKLSGFQAN